MTEQEYTQAKKKVENLNDMIARMERSNLPQSQRTFYIVSYTSERDELLAEIQAYEYEGSEHDTSDEFDDWGDLDFDDEGLDPDYEAFENEWDDGDYDYQS